VLDADPLQLSGIPGRRDAARACASGAALPIATFIATFVAGATGCATSKMHGAGADAEPGPADAPAEVDAKPIVHPDAKAPPDAGLPDAGCMISANEVPLLDGNGDLAKYAAAQVIAPGAMAGSSDAVGLTWDRASLYVTVTSDAFVSDYKPLHIYIEESAGALGAATPSTGKEYGGLTPQLPFTPTHLIAVRRVSDAGTGPYDAVFAPTNGWTTRVTPLVEGTDVVASADHTSISTKVPWTALGGCPTSVRLAVHVVNGVAANEWKDLVPTTTTPWVSPGGGYYEIDLTQPPPVTSWTLR